MAGLEQKALAVMAGISLRTVTNAESGNCSTKTWNKLTAIYRPLGLRLIDLPSLSGQLVPMIAIDGGLDRPATKEAKERATKNAGPYLA